MIKIYNFDNVENSGISYGGHGGSKKGIIIDNERWFLKYPKSTSNLNNVELSYSTMPISEYLGSHIYESIGIETHETKLGITNNKVVVACKDFLKSSEVIFDYNILKNEYDEEYEKQLEKISSHSISNDNLEEVIFVLENNKYFIDNPKLKERFWDMFIIDAFINNNDRNEGNWGLIFDKENGRLRICPVYDNGASFYNKSNDNKINSILSDEFKLKQVIYDSAISIFKLVDKPINPLKYIESMKNEDCNLALLRLFNKIDMNIIKNIFNEIPEKYNDIIILSKEQRELYLKMLEYRYNIFYKTYEVLSRI